MKALGAALYDTAGDEGDMMYDIATGFGKATDVEEPMYIVSCS